MMQSKMAFLVEESHLTVGGPQPIQRHHTRITNLVEEHQKRTHSTSSLRSGGQSENMSKPRIHHHSLSIVDDLHVLITQPQFRSARGASTVGMHTVSAEVHYRL